MDSVFITPGYSVSYRANSFWTRAIVGFCDQDGLYPQYTKETKEQGYASLWLEEIRECKRHTGPTNLPNVGGPFRQKDLSARKHSPENDIFQQLKKDGLLRSKSLGESRNSNVAFYVSLDGTIPPSPRLLKSLELDSERERIRASVSLAAKLERADRRRDQSIRKLELKARSSNSKVSKAQRKRQEKLDRHKNHLDSKLETAEFNRRTMAMESEIKNVRRELRSLERFYGVPGDTNFCV